MIVLLPTYNRLEALQAVIDSILNSHTQNVKERILVVVANNSFSLATKIDELLSHCDFQAPFQVLAIHRRETLTAIENWFSAIFQVAQEGELVILLGDDDILLPHAISQISDIFKCYPQIDMLVSNYLSRIFFSPDCKKFSYISQDNINKLPASKAVQSFDFNDHTLRASFISSHSYRYSRLIKESYELAISWCKIQDWVNWSQASGLLPTWLSYAVNLNGGQICYNQNHIVLRGQLLSEMNRMEYADGGSTTLYCLLYVHMFSTRILSTNDYALAHNYNIALRFVQANWLQLLLNKKLSHRQKTNSIKAANLTWPKIIFSYYSIISIPLQILKCLPYIKGIRARIHVSSKGMHINYMRTFLDSLHPI